MSEISNVLVTGGCGFLGKHVVQRLLALGASVTILDNLSLGGAFLPADAVTLAVGDVADPAFVSDVARSEPFSHVVHLAALHYIPKCDAEPKLAFMTNVVGTRNVVAACSRIPPFALSSTHRQWRSTPHPRRPMLRPHSACRSTSMGGRS